EFTNMEFYWAYANYNDGMKLVRELYIRIAQEVFDTTSFKSKGMKYDLADNWKEIDYRDEIKKQTGIDVLKTTLEDMQKKLDELEVKYDGSNRERLMDTLWKYCRKNIAGPAFLINHPKLVSPLAKAKVDNPKLTERFQIIIAGSEIGNGYSELNDPVDQRKRFEEQQALIDRGDDEAMMPDWEFVEMLEHGMPPTCGFGFGERLFAFLVNKSLRETQLFPLVKPKAIVSSVEVKAKIIEKTNSTVDVKEDSDLGISLEDAEKLVEKYISNETTKLHSIESGLIMQTLAQHFHKDNKATQEKWYIMGLLHDIDWDITKDTNIKDHTIKAMDILKDAGCSEFLIETIVSHGYGNKECGKYPDKERSSRLQHLLAAAETVTGLIIASSLVRPDKDIKNVKLSSLKKKFKTKKFAANCNRDIISECEKAGLSLDEFLEISLGALKQMPIKN
ncbi:MAG TPA: hypothetical protein ENL09_07165, partial [Bacteroidetes bacterium]|nr:hypothetical protein [Bacteroidota bacterium]